MSKLTPEDQAYGLVNVVASVLWGAFAWWFAWVVGAPVWACWILAFLSADAQSNSGGIRYRIKKLMGGDPR